MTNEEIKSAATLVLAAIKMVELPPGEVCKHCDPDVGWLCPQCGLIVNAGDLARHCLWALRHKGVAV